MATRPPPTAGVPEARGTTPAPAPRRRRPSPAYLLMLMTSGRRGGPLPLPADAVGPIADILRSAQGSAGNQAVANLVEGSAAAPDLAGGLPSGPVPDTPEDAAAEPADDSRDPDRPTPADPAGTPPDPAGGRPELPPHAPTPALAAPGGAPRPVRGGGGGAAAVPAEPSADAVVTSAAATASAMPHPRAGAAPALPARARRPPPRREAAVAIPGPPPVPKLQPSFADIPDPIQPATLRIQEVANRTLPEQALPPLSASPGGHMPVVPEQPISSDQRRLIMLGEPAMDTAGLSHASDPPTPGDPRPGSERARLLAIREAILRPLAPAPEGAAAAPPAPSLTLRSPPLPAADVTLAEQELFSALLARLSVDTEESARRVLRDIKASMRDYPGGVLNSTDHDGLDGLGRDKLPELGTRLGDRVNATARTMGAAGAMLDQAVTARRQELESAAAAEAEGRDTTSAAAIEAAETAARSRFDAASTARSTAEEARLRARAAGPAPVPGFRATAEAAVARIQAKVSEAIAGFRLQKADRARELDAARDRIISAYELSVAADEVAAQEANPAPASPTDLTGLLTSRRRVSAAINRAREWRDREVAALRTIVQQHKNAANTASDTNITDVEDQGAAAFRDLRAWGGTQEGASEQWWQDSVADLDRWAEAAHDTASTWAEAEARLARMELQRDVGRIRERMERSIAENAENAAAYALMTEDQKRDFIVRTVSTSSQPNFLDQLSTSLMTRQVAQERDAIEPEIESQLRSLPRGKWEDIEYAAQAKNPGFRAQERSNAIYTAGYDKYGTDAPTIYAQLEGLRPIELDAVTKCYGERRESDTALYDDLDAEFSGDEWRRAEALMVGDPVAAAVEAIHDAAWGPGTSVPQIMAALRSIETLPEGERSAARTRLASLYMAQYGESLESVLSGDMEGSELGQAEALRTGDAENAEAYEMDVALDGGLNRDPTAAAAIYERIRSETMARAQAEGWTSAEFDAEVARRNQVLETRFGEHFRGAPRYNWGDGTTLQNAIGYSFARDRGAYDMVNALARGDMEAVDAGRMESERDSNYADDEVVGAAVRVQFNRALERTQLDRAPELRQGIDAQIRRESETARLANAPLSEREVMDRRMALQRQMDATLADEAFDRSRASTERLNQRLTSRYGRSLDDMLSQTMSDNVFGQGGALTDARARLEIMRRGDDDAARASRRLDWAYARIRYGIEGAGTNMDELRGGFAGLTLPEINVLDRRWRNDHGGETLRSAVQEDTGGREEDDLVDTVDHGAATTTEGRVDELRRRLRRDEESVGLLGHLVTRNESRDSHRTLRRLEAMSAQLDDPNLSDERRAHLAGAFNQRVENAGLAIAAQRAEVDSYADAFTTVLQYVIGAVALVLGVVAGIVTGGAAVPALIAIAGSVIGTLSGMAAKAAIKGGAYGAEEITTDLVVGAVDLVVTLATVGAFKGSSLWAKEGGRTIIGAAREGMRTYSRATLRGTLRQVAQRTASSAAERAVEGGMRRGLGTRAAAFGRDFFTNQGIDMVTAIPTAIAANVMNEENWAHGNPFGHIARGTIDASIENLKNGMVMGIGGTAVHAGIGRFTHVQHRPMTPIEAHARDLRVFRELNPGSSHAAFVAHIEAQQAASSADADAVRAATREVRATLLDSLPPRERAAIADVPILHVGEAQFRALNKGNFGDALIHVHDGQAVVVVREGAPPTSVWGLAGDLRAIVAPGTSGRTVNPVDSLPPRLRNRVTVEVVNRPGFGPSEVRAVPIRNEAGHITGVALQVGPNAHAADIHGHVATVDAMRRLAGVAGQARLLMNDMGRAMGMDLVSPRERGRWEASLEVAKLPGIIDEHIQRLSEHGLDPRRRALVMEEIAGLQRQLDGERARLARGAAAEERGYVAAAPKKPRAVASAADIDADLAQRARGREIVADLASIEPGLVTLERRFAEMESHPQNAMWAIDNNLELVLERKPGDRYPPPPQLVAIREMIADRRLGEASAALHEWLADKGSSPRLELLRELQARYETTQARFVAERDALLERIQPVREHVDRLRAELNQLRMFNGIALHPDLPNPVAGLLYKPDARTLEALAAHLNGYIAEIRLANHIAHKNLGVVIDYGHSVGVNYADVISVDPQTGRVTLWDSKFRSGSRAGRHSETFTNGGRLTSARNQALKVLATSSHGLTPAVHARAKAFLTNWDFDATTSHTNGGGFAHETLRVTEEPTL